MSNLLKCGVSALALMIGVGAADAQNMDKQQGQSPQMDQIQRDDGDSGDRDRNVERRKGGASDEGTQNDRRQDDQRDRARADHPEGRKKTHVTVNITPEKKTVIRERVVTRAPKRYKRNDVHFSLSVGTRVPRNLAIYHVPSTFIDIVPEYRDYDYIVVGDLILIVDPDTREIVDVIAV